MLSLALRLALSSDRQTRGRLAGITIGLALSTLLLLLLLAAVNALGRRDQRSSWQEIHYSSSAIAAGRSMRWNRVDDTFRGLKVTFIVVDTEIGLATTPSGLDRWPRHGEYFLSAPLQHLAQSVPTNQLRDRFPGQMKGLVGNSALASRDQLLAVVGTDLSRRSAVLMDRLSDAPPRRDPTYTIVFAVEIAGVFFPLAVFVGTACRLGTAQRERRLASLRLVGATSRQIVFLAAVESVLGAGIGVSVGVALYLVLRPYAAAIPFMGGLFFLDDFAVDFHQMLLATAAVLGATVVSALIALRQVQISPLGVMRRHRAKKSTAWRLLPMVAGFVVLQAIHQVWGGINGRASVDALTGAVLLGFLGIAAGIVIAGPWFTQWGGSLLALRAGSPAGLMAGRRLEQHPTAIFHSVSGVVLGLFICTTFTACLQQAGMQSGNPPILPVDTTIVHFAYNENVPDYSMMAPLLLQYGFKTVIPIYTPPSAGQEERFWLPQSQFAKLGVKGKLGPGDMVEVNLYDLISGKRPTPAAWKTVNLSRRQKLSLKLNGLVLRAADADDTGATDRLRTLATQLLLHQPSIFSMKGMLHPSMPPELALLQQMGYAGTAISILVAGCNLAVSVLGSILERRRSLGLLRLAGMPTITLLRLVFLEGALPLLGVSLLSIATGFAVACQLTHIVDWNQPHSMPPTYFVTVAVSLLFSLGVLTSTVPLIRRMTEGSAVHTD